MTSGMLLALAIFIVLALVVGGLVITFIVGPTARARRKRASQGPTPDTDGEPGRVV